MNKKEAQRLTEKGRLRADDYEAGAMTLQTYHAKIVTQSMAGSQVLVERGRIKDDVSDQLKVEGYKVRCKWDSESGMYWTRVSWEVDSPEKNLLLWVGIGIGALLLLCVGLLVWRVYGG